MTSPGPTVVKVDRQGRLVLPQALRARVTTTPGEVLVTPTVDGLVVSAVAAPGEVETDRDGLPVLRFGRVVTNDEVLAALDEDRADR